MARKSRKNVDTVVVTGRTAITYNVAAYIRLSVEDNNKKGDSLETQKAILQNFIAVTPDMKFHDYYIDNGSSGTTFERPAFKKMLADVEKGVVNCIIVKDLSRLGRNAIDTGYYIERFFPMLGVRFIAVTDNFDTNSDMNNGAGVILPLKNIINEAYALDIGRKIKAQQQQAMKSGDYVGARPPYGYLKAPDNCHKLIVDRITAPVVQQIYKWFLENISVNDIARRLNESGITTPSHYQREIGLVTNEKLIGKGAWQTFTVERILTREVYVGDMVQGKSKSTFRKQTAVPESKWIRVPDTHEAIISREAFAKAQERLKYLADKSAAQKKTPYTPNIFKGKVFCGHCGGALHRQRNKRSKTEDIYVFHCLSNSRKARGSCIPYIMPEQELLEALFVMIQAHSEVILGKSLKIRKNTPVIEASRDTVKSELVALRQEADKHGRMFKSLYESLVNGLITADEYRDMRKSYEEKVQDCLAKATALEYRQAELDKQIAEYCVLSDLIENMAHSGITSELIDRLIGRIKINPDRSIDVDFSFNSGFDLMSEVTADE